VVIAIDILSPPNGTTVSDPVVTFEYEIYEYDILNPLNPPSQPSLLGVGNIEWSLDNVHFTSIFEGERNQDLNDSDFFPEVGTFEIELPHGLHVIHFRARDRLNTVGDTDSSGIPSSLVINVDISTTITIDPLPTITNNPTQIVTGTRETDAIVTVTVNGVPVTPVDYPSSTTWSVTAVLQEGNNIIAATATDAESNTATTTAGILLDTIAPAAPIVDKIDSAAPEYILGDEVVTNIVSQIISGQKETETAIWMNSIEIVPLNIATTFAIPVTLAEGENTFTFNAVDAANNSSADLEVIITLDTIAPQFPSIIINEGADFTLVRDVVLELEAADATEFKVDEDPNFVNSEWQPFTSSPLSISFELSQGGGLKIIYAIFRDAVGNETSPVSDSIILPATLSEEIDSADMMTIQSLTVDPEENYYIKLRDNRDGSFDVELYMTFLDAQNGTNLLASATSATPGSQELTLTGVGITSGTIEVTLIEGAEIVIYRYRTDVYNASEGDSPVPVIYEVVERDDSFEAQINVPFYEDSRCSRIVEHPVDGDLAKIRIPQVFELADEDTIIYNETYYPVNRTRLFYPLVALPMNVLEIEEVLVDEGGEDVPYFIVTLDAEIETFESVFGCEFEFSKRDKAVTDYRIFKTGRVEFYNESEIASGDVEIAYKRDSFIESLPSEHFKCISAIAGSKVDLTVLPVNNKILLSDLDRISLRFFHATEDTTRKAPLYIEVTINDTHSAIVTNFTIVDSNQRAEIREFVVPSSDLFPDGFETYGYDVTNPTLDKVTITFLASSNTTCSDELEVVARSGEVNSNCRVVVNGEERHLGEASVSRKFDTYELRVQNNIVDVLCSGELVHTEELDLDGATASIGGGARVDGDSIELGFNQFTTIQYIDSSPAGITVPVPNPYGDDDTARYIETEVNLRRSIDSTTLLRDFEVDFTSEEPEYISRIYAPTVFSTEFRDTSTVAIIGMGSREEMLVNRGGGEEDEGEPVDFVATNDPDGRHFILASFPIVSGSLEVYRQHSLTERLLEESVDYLTDEEMGQIVLLHPIAQNDRLWVKYASLADTNVPELFLELDDLIEKFGEPSVDNSLALGAQLAFANGAKRVLAVQALNPTSDPGWVESFAALEKEEAYYVVPIPPSDYNAIATIGTRHVNKESSVKYRHERVLILGETEGFDFGTLESLGMLSSRVVFLQAPGPISTVLSGETAQLDGRHLAAAYSGRASAINLVSEPLTGKILTGLTIDSEVKFSNLELETLVKQGIVIVVHRLPSGGKIHRSITTVDSDFIPSQEPSIVRLMDYVALNMRYELEQRFVGRVITEQILEELTTTADRFLQLQTGTRVISRYENLRVKQDSQEPRQVNVHCDIWPMYPLNKITISVNTVVSI